MRPDRGYASFLRSLSGAEALDLLPQGARIRIACSGGTDSTALVLLFHRLQQRRRSDLQLSIGHVHHGLRGAEADAAAAGCQQLAAQLGWSFHQEDVDVNAYRAATGDSEETAARHLRREAYQQWAEADDLWAIALAHHRDDQAETVLGNLMRGTGLHGLAGMQQLTRLDRSGSTLLLRPLLNLPQAELSDFVAHCNAATFEDSSNHSTEHRRNRIRHQLLPALEQYNPQVKGALDALAVEAQEVDRWLRDLARPLIEACQWGRDVAVIERRKLPEDPTSPLLGVLFREMWARVAQRESGLTRDHHDTWARIATASSDGDCYALPGGYRIERTAQVVSVYRPTECWPTECWPAPATDPDRLGPGLVTHTAFGLSARAMPGADGAVSLPPLDASTHWRSVGKADRIPISDGHALVAEVLRSAGVPRDLRAHYPVLVSGRKQNEESRIEENVIWLPGIRVAACDRSGASGTITIAETCPEAVILAASLGQKLE